MEPEPEEAGVDAEVARLLADSWSHYKVLFLQKVPAGELGTEEWNKESNGTSYARIRGTISGLCLASDLRVIETLFNQPGYDWSQQGQLVLLFSSDTDPVQLPATKIAKAIANQNLNPLVASTPLQGYLRPGDDGDFFEISFKNEFLRQQWLELIAACADKRGLFLIPDKQASAE